MRERVSSLVPAAQVPVGVDSALGELTMEAIFSRPAASQLAGFSEKDDADVADELLIGYEEGAAWLLHVVRASLIEPYNLDIFGLLLCACSSG